MISWKNALIRLLALCSALVSPLALADEAAPTSAPAGPRPLRRILIAESVEAVEKLTPTSGSGFVVLSPALSSVDLAELTKRLAPGENQGIDNRLLAAVAQVVEVFFRQNDFPAAAAIIPTQSIAEGTLRVIVLLGKIRNINVQGARWFSESLLRDKLRIEQGGIVRFSELDRAISWTNNSPYRRVKVKLDPVPDTGEADLTIAVAEAMPLRVGLIFDNTGNEAIGKNRYTATVSYANLWGRDHQVSYQYLTTDQTKVFKGHGFDYRVPLPWRHYVQVSGSYIRATPEFYEGLFVQDGETVTADLRYTVPLRYGATSGDAYATLNFKESNNNLAYGGTSVQATKTDVFQLTMGASLLRRDKRGAWLIGASVTFSPGDINSRNTDRAFDGSFFGGDSARFGAKSTYLYGNVSFQRLLNLPKSWDLMLRGSAQAAQANLLPSEQIGVGGSSSVRGFQENVFTGDHGFVLTSELMAPSWKITVPKISKTRGPLDVRLLAFVDAGNTAARYKHWTDPQRRALASSGVGLRASLAHHFSLTADYGWQMSDLPYTVEERSRGHIRASIAY